MSEHVLSEKKIKELWNYSRPELTASKEVV